MNNSKQTTIPSGWLLAFYYTAIPMVANLAAALGLGYINVLLIREPGFQASIKLLEAQQFQMMLATFIPAITVILVYILPVYFGLNRVRRGEVLSDITKRRLLNGPFMVSIMGMVGWLIAVVFSVVFFSSSKNISMEFMYIIRMPLLQLLNGFLCFVISYYLLDTVNRRILIPRVFPNGEFLQEKGILKFSVRSRFFFLYIAVVVFPVFFLFNIMYSNLLEEKATDQITLLVISTLGLLILALVLMLLNARTYQNPLKKLKEAADNIGEGKLDVNLQVLSTDELGYLSQSVNEMAFSLKEKEFMKDTFGKLVDPAVRDHLLQGNVRLGGEITETAILFTDIRSFTTLAEGMDPEAVVDLLNNHFETMSNCVVSYGGMVNKFIGDAIMALFGVPVSMNNPAEAALKTGIAMRLAQPGLNSALKLNNMPAIKTGIGIHIGKVLAGNIGCSTRMEYTVIGDAVNLASRIEGVTKMLKAPLIISDAVYRALPDPGKYKLREIDSVLVKGKSVPVVLYECYDGDEEIVKKAKEANKSNFQQAIVLYKTGDFSAAEEIFTKCIKDNPADFIPGIYTIRCRNFIKEPPGEQWQGVFNLG